MYAQLDAPFGSRASHIAVKAVAMWDEGALADLSSGAGNVGVINVVFVDEAHVGTIGYERSANGDTTTKNDICCTQALYDLGSCQSPGSLNLDAVDASDLGESLELVTSVGISGAPPQAVEASFQVSLTGEQLVTFFYCPLNSDAPAVTVEGKLTFENPYGYLSGKSIGFLPFYGLMVTMYLLLMCSFLFFLVRHCRNLLWIQYFLFGLITLGFVEVCGWFLLYLQLNYSGVPVCCPLYDGAVVTVVLNVFKRAMSRCLLLAVCLGFGVVRPVLGRGETCVITGLGCLFMGFAIYADIRINNVSTTQTMDLWGLPVTVLDTIFVTWTYHALTRVQAELERRGQGAKLAMYSKLSSTLVTFVFLWVSFAFFTITVTRGSIPFDWKWQWTLHSFWHVAYFAILCVVGAVWAPSPSSHQYAYSFQIATSAEEADAYEMDLECDDEFNDDFDAGTSVGIELRETGTRVDVADSLEVDQEMDADPMQVVGVEILPRMQGDHAEDDLGVADSKNGPLGNKRMMTALKNASV